MLRNIRKKSGLSQSKVKDMTGIHEDTLRKLENGLVIPKYETIEILSVLYKCDLLKVLENYRKDENFYKYYKRMDLIISNNEFSLLDELISDFKEDVKNYPLPSLLISNVELRQFELFLNAITDYRLNTIYSHKNAEQILLDALSLTINDFKIDILESFCYNFFEIRILLLLGLIKEMLGERPLSTKILLFVLEYLIQGSDIEHETQILILKIYTNLSYNYHKEDNNILALKYAEEGIDYAIKNSNMNFLFLLFGRKGIAEFRLDYPCYLDSLQKSIHLLEINKQFKLAEVYKHTYYEKYKISLQ
ncbi:MAG: transcriptional regulator, family [Anaerocolumna sp.]|jgi:transcriptional regulator with XRE-family HTH domain|nr:transcriptional regulator, family [Anaerocolumna sp.]